MKLQIPIRWPGREREASMKMTMDPKHLGWMARILKLAALNTPCPSQAHASCWRLGGAALPRSPPGYACLVPHGDWAQARAARRRLGARASPKDEQCRGDEMLDVSRRARGIEPTDECARVADA